MKNDSSEKEELANKTEPVKRKGLHWSAQIGVLGNIVAIITGCVAIYFGCQQSKKSDFQFKKNLEKQDSILQIGLETTAPIFVESEGDLIRLEKKSNSDERLIQLKGLVTNHGNRTSAKVDHWIFVTTDFGITFKIIGNGGNITEPVPAQSSFHFSSMPFWVKPMNTKWLSTEYILYSLDFVVIHHFVYPDEYLDTTRYNFSTKRFQWELNGKNRLQNTPVPEPFNSYFLNQLYKFALANEDGQNDKYWKSYYQHIDALPSVVDTNSLNEYGLYYYNQ